MKKIFLILIVSCVAHFINAQEFIPLWPTGKKPNWNGKNVSDSVYNERTWRVGTPGMYVFLANPSENKGTTVLICPGGGYERVSHIYNGFNFAKWFNTHGINAFVLLYRLPHQQDLKNRETAPLTDVQRAMRLLKGNADRWHLAKEKIGVMGVSAGGHLASTLATHFDDVSSIQDSLDKASYHPGFSILLSPVISMGQFAHGGSRSNLLGSNPSKALIDKYSNELRVTNQTPPTFIVHAQNDSTVNVKNSVLYFNALIDKGVQASMHVFPQGGHGIKLVENPGSTELWLDLLYLWMKEKRFITPEKK